MEKETDKIVKEIESLIHHQVCGLLTGGTHSYEDEPIRRLIDCWMEKTQIHEKLNQLAACTTA